MAQMCEQFWHKYAKRVHKANGGVAFKHREVGTKLSSFATLDKREKELLLPLLIKMLNHRDGKENVFSNTKIRQSFIDMGEVVSEKQIRKLVYYIRNNGLIELLIANGEGYYIAEHSQDIESWLKMQRGKIEAMKQTINSIQSQYEDNVGKIKLGKSKLYPQLKFEFW